MCSSSYIGLLLVGGVGVGVGVVSETTQADRYWAVRPAQRIFLVLFTGAELVGKRGFWHC